MSDAIITVILTQLGTILEQKIRRELRLVCGVEKEFRKLQSEFKSISAVLVDAEKRQVKEEQVKVWLENLRDVSYETEDVLSEWITETEAAEIELSHSKKVSSLFNFPCLGFNRVAVRRSIALKIKKLNEKLSEIAVEKDRYNFIEFSGSECFDRPHSASYINVSEVEGRDLDKKVLIGKVLSDRNQEKGLNVVSVVGLGGIGKTTLAQLVYNSSDVIQHFDRRIWVCVSDPFDEVRIAKAILEDIEGSAPYLFELETVARKIRNYVEGEKFLLVLDDVWTEDFRKWEQLFASLKTGANGSTILVTTRKESVANAMGSSYHLRLGSLSEVDSWTLFEKIAFFERKREECERLENVGKMIAKKCKGLPLAIKTIGSLMRSKSSLSDWEGVLDSEFWELEEAEGVFPPLMLSYYDLPSAVKRCFSFCAFFPKDHVIEASNLIQLWMAQGYLTSSKNVEMEVIGQEYLETLVMRSFFQEIGKDKTNGERVVSFKMHDMVHAFAHYLSKNECSVIDFNNDFQRKMGSSHKRARHVTVVRSEDAQFPKVTNVEKLFTLWVQSFYDSPPIVSQLDQIEPDFVRNLTCLRALDLSRNRIGDLPKEIGSLVKLKYLNLSHNPFWELPETLSDLYNLLTLKLSACDHLRRLPSKISNLVNLRHLEIDHTASLKSLPKGIGNLRSLRTLSKFIVVRASDRGETTCGLEELKNLNNLQGCLKIEGLGYVDATEAKKADLKQKIHLSELELDFGPLIETGRQDEVMEALEVHANLQSLQISSYGGMKLPNWLMKLTNLKRLFLQDCENCTNLPPLGRLPSLVTLHLEGMKSLDSLGLESLGIREDDDSRISGMDRSDALPAFPKLKKLKVSKMERWEEWNLSDEEFQIMPRLRCLKISQCSKLRVLPTVLLQKSPIRKLRIDNCPLLMELYNRETGEYWSRISHISKTRVS